MKLIQHIPQGGDLSWAFISYAKYPDSKGVKRIMKIAIYLKWFVINWVRVRGIGILR